MTPQKLVTVKLKVPHTHEGMKLSADSEVSVSQADADWLTSNGIADAPATAPDDSKPGKKS